MNYNINAVILATLVLAVGIGGTLYWFSLQDLAAIPPPISQVPLPVIPNNPTSTTYSKDIPTDYGVLTLTYASGTATLSGTLDRSTPCINWQIAVTSTKDLPPSEITLSLNPTSTAEVCVQVLGKPQTVSSTVTAGANSHYTVNIREKVVFSGKLNTTN